MMIVQNITKRVRGFNIMQRTNMNDVIKEREKEVSLAYISVAANSAGFAGASGMGLSYSGIFANYYHSPIGTALTGLGSYILYPIVAFASAVETVASWSHTNKDRRRKDNKLKNRNVANSIVTTLASAGFTAAIIGSLVAATTFTLAAPVMFMSVIGGRAIYNIVAAMYYKYRSSTVERNTKYDTAAKKAEVKTKYISRANQHVKNAALGAVAFTATTTVFLLGYLFLAPIGIAVNAIFMAMAIAGITLGIKSIKTARKAEVIQPQNESQNAEQEPLISAMDNDITIESDKLVSAELNETNESADTRPTLRAPDKIANDRDWAKNTGIFITPRPDIARQDNVTFLNNESERKQHGLRYFFA
jgi:hypothetical protein